MNESNKLDGAKIANAHENNKAFLFRAVVHGFSPKGLPLKFF